MEKSFELNFRKSNGNLHIHPVGALNNEMVDALDNVMENEYGGSGRIFVRTADIELSDKDGLGKGIIIPQGITKSDVYFKGEKGFDIAPDGTRVIISSRDMGGDCRCSGKCRVCKCELLGRAKKCCSHD